MVESVPYFLTKLALPVLGCLTKETRRQFEFLVNSSSNVEKLKAKVETLGEKVERIKHFAEQGLDQGKYTERSVRHWLISAERLVEEGNEAAGSGRASFLRAWTRYKQGKNIAIKLKEIEQHSQQQSEPADGFSYVYQASRHGVPSNKQTVHLDSRRKIQDEILGYLDDVNIDVVGLVGMGGVGKTTLANQVLREAKNSKKFDEVRMIPVTHTPSRSWIFKDVMEVVERLQLDWESNGKKNAPKKTVLIILDDLWEKLDLKDIGIKYSEQKIKIKLLLTSRFRSLLVDQMNAEKCVQLNVLTKEDSWKMFGELVGRKEMKARKIKGLTVQALYNNCGGLPITIEALATIFKKNTADGWVKALESIKKSPSENTGQSAIKLTYQHLDDDKDREAKMLFRTCGLIGSHDIPVHDLFKYGIALCKSFREMDLIRARARLRKLVGQLQDSFLLLESESKDHVKIHDVARDAVTQIDPEDKTSAPVLFDNGNRKPFPKVENLRKLAAIYLCRTDIQHLPREWKGCVELHTLIVHVNDVKTSGRTQGDYVEVPKELFNKMSKLKVVDFRRMRFQKLTSLESLRNLITLCLDYCHVEDLSNIKNLKGLQALSLVGCDLTSLPEEVGQLSSLRLLDLTKCSKLEEIKHGILAKLVNLEELYLRESFANWEMIEVDAEPHNASLAEVAALPQLHTFVALVPDARMLPGDLPFDKLSMYVILVGDGWKWSDDNQELRTLKLHLKDNHVLFGERAQATLQSTEELHLSGLGEDDYRSIQELCVQGFQHLKYLLVQNCPLVHYIFRTVKPFPSNAYIALESLILKDLPNLKKISDGLLTEKSFSRLKVLQVHNCKQLDNIFTHATVKGLTELEEIQVTDCDKVKEIVTIEQNKDDASSCSCKCLTKSLVPQWCGCFTRGDGEDGTIVRFTKLRRLTLSNLQNLGTFARNGDASSSSNTQPAPPALFDGRYVSFPSLEYLTLSSIPVDEIWGNVGPPMELVTLRSLQLKDCKKIKKAMISSMLTKLQNFESLVIDNCELLEEVLDLKKGKAVDILPQFCELKLKNLPELMTIWINNPKRIRGFQQFMCLEVDNCPKLKTILPPSSVRAMSKLAHIEIIRCKEMKGIVQVKGTLSAIRFPALKTLMILECPNMDSFLTCGDPNKGCSGCCSLGFGKWSKDDKACFFGPKVALPNLEDLILSCLGNFAKLWHDELPPEDSSCSLSKLAKLGIRGCANLSSVFPATLLGRLKNLKEVIIIDCIGLKKIFDVDSLKEFQRLELSKLKLMILEDLQKLQHVVENKKDTLVVGFPNLMEINLKRCKALKSLIPDDTAATLSKLEILEIADCENMEEIVQWEHRHEDIFPYLTSLKLSNLASLVYFSPESCRRLCFPSLKELEVNKCPKMNTFCPNSIHPPNQGEPPLFGDKVVLRNLTNLHVRDMEVDSLWHNEPRARSFCKLKTLKVEHCGKLVNVVPPFMSEVLQNLHKLKVSNCNNLDSIYLLGQESHSNRYLRNLTFVSVRSCASMKLFLEREGKGELGEPVENVWFPSMTNLDLSHLPKLSLDTKAYDLLFGKVIKQQRVFKCSSTETIKAKIQKLEEETIYTTTAPVQHGTGSAGIRTRLFRPDQFKQRGKENDNEIPLFPSRSAKLDAIIKALRNEEISTIGIKGEYGVGKTSLMRQCQKKVEEDELFDHVLLVNASSMEAAQSDLERHLDLKKLEVKKGAATERAHFIHEKWSNKYSEKKVLLILDDIRMEMDLTAIGIPTDETIMIILTSELKDVLKSMGAQKFTRLERLKGDEVIDFFKQLLGKQYWANMGSLASEELLNRAASLCYGLPLAIQNLASFMKDRSPGEVNKVFEEMEKLRFVFMSNFFNWRRRRRPAPEFLSECMPAPIPSKVPSLDPAHEPNIDSEDKEEEYVPDDKEEYICSTTP